MENEESRVIGTEAVAPGVQPPVTGIDVLKIEKGDTVIIYADTDNPQQAQYITGVFAAIIQAKGLVPAEDVFLLILPSNLEIKVLDPERMKEQGWIRTQRFRIATPGNGFNPR